MSKINTKNFVPRASKADRLSFHRKKNPSLLDHSLSKSKRNFRYLYFFYLALLASGFLVAQFYKNNKMFASTQVKQKKIIISPGRSALINLIQSRSRNGVSLLIRNKKKIPWYIDKIIVSFPGGSYSESEINIGANSFYTLFLETPSTFKNIHTSSISIKTKEEL